MNTTKNIIKFVSIVAGTVAVGLLGVHIAQAAQQLGAAGSAVTVFTAAGLVGGFGR